MTSRVFLLFLFISLGSTIAAIDQTGLIVRITHHITDIVKQAGVAFVGRLENRTLQDIQVNQWFWNGTISSLKFRNLSVTPDQVSFTFQEASGILFEIKDVHFHIDLNNREVSFHGHITRAKIEMKLKQEQGHLALQDPACEVTADSIRVDTAGVLGSLLNTKLAKYIIKLLFNSQICGIITKYGVPALNRKLAEATAVMKPWNDYNLTIDMSLSGKVAVTASHLDVPFKGVVSLVNQTAPDAPGGPDPVFTHDQINHMVYVGASQVFFNSATQALYRAGALSTSIPITNVFVKALLRALQLVMQPSQLPKHLSGELKVTKLPNISITQRDGVTVKIAVSGRVTPPPPASALISISVTAICNVADFNVSVEGHALIFHSQTARCTVDSGSGIRDSLKNNLLDLLTKKAKQYLSALFVPLPDGMNLTVADISYRDGFLVVGGSVSLDRDENERLVDLLFQPISKKMFKD